MKRIDSRLDAALSDLEANPESTPLEIALKLATLIPPLAPVLAPLDALREHFSTRNKVQQIVCMLRTFNAEFQALQQECALEAHSHLMIDSYLNSPRFTDAVIAAAEETTRTANADKILRFGLVLANGCDPKIDVSDDEDLSSFIRDVSQLSELDLRALQIVTSTARVDILLESDVPDSTDNMLGQHLIAAAAREKLEQDDFYSHAYRLVGFGFLLEAPSNGGRRNARDLRFVPTRRGRKFLALLKKRTAAPTD